MIYQGVSLANSLNQLIPLLSGAPFSLGIYAFIIIHQRVFVNYFLRSESFNVFSFGRFSATYVAFGKIFIKNFLNFFV